MRLAIPIKNVLDAMGTYGEIPSIGISADRSTTRQFMASLYGNKIQTVNAYDSEENHLPLEIKDDDTVIDICRRFFFNGSPCFKVTDVTGVLDLLVGVPKETFRFLPLYGLTILCVKDKDLALKLKLSI